MTFSPQGNSRTFQQPLQKPMHSRDKEIVKLPDILPQLGRRGMKPTTRTRAQNPLPEFSRWPKGYI